MIKENYFWTASFSISYDIMNCVEFSKYQKMIPLTSDEVFSISGVTEGVPWVRLHLTQENTCPF